MLIPKFQSCGAVVASVIAEAIISSLFWKNSDGIVDLKTLFNVSWKKACSGIIMLFGINCFNFFAECNSVVTLVIDIGLGVIVYVFLLLFLFKDKWTTNIVVSFYYNTKRKVAKR